MLLYIGSSRREFDSSLQSLQATQVDAKWNIKSIEKCLLSRPLRAFLLTVRNLLYVFNSKAVVQCIYVVNVQFLTLVIRLFLSWHQPPGICYYYYFFLFKELPVSRDIPIENSIPLPAVCIYTASLEY